MIDAVHFIQDNGIQRIDLMQVNIAGGEFHLLPYLINSGIISRVQALQIQWHVDFEKPDGPQGQDIKDRIQCKLAEQYTMTYNVHAFEGWQRREQRRAEKILRLLGVENV